MSLTELIAGVESHEMTLTVFNAAPEATTELRERFADRNISVVAGETADGPREYVVLSKDDRFVTGARIADILRQPDDENPGFDADAYRPILDHLDGTMFTSYDIKQMVAASREIEDRAWRVAKGELHAGFQKLSVIETQLDVYEQLASLDDLDVHTYGYPDTEPPSHEDFTIHIERAEEIRNSWFVAFDGAGINDNKCALLAEEREPRRFYGFWTYDPGTVDYIIKHLKDAYGLIEQR